VAADTRDAPAEEIAGASGPPWRSWLVGLVTAALLVGYLVVHRQPAQPAAPTTKEPPAAAAVAPGSSGSRTPIGLGPPGLRLLVGGPSPRLVDASTGSYARLDVPAVGTRAPAWLVPAGRAVLAFVSPLGPQGETIGARRGYLIRPGAPAVPLGEVDGGLATRAGGVITVVRRPAGTTLSGFDANGVRRWQRRVATGVEPRADTRYGLLVQVADPAAPGQFGPLRLVDPVTGRLRRELARQAPTLLASGDGAVAWLGPGSCPPDCAVRVTDLATGRTRNVGTRFRHAPVAASFGPADRLLALTFETGWPADGATPYPDGLVGLVDLRSGTVSVVRGYGGGLYAPSWVDWSAGGHLVVLMTTLIGPRERLRVSVARRPGRPDGFTLLPWAFLSTRSLTVAP
jgi:hypothetical protein